VADLPSANGYRVKSASMPWTRLCAPPCCAGARTGELRANASDATRASAEAYFGWKPTVDHVDGVERPIQWLRTVLELEPASLRGA
jgi:hypothetical protein